MDIPNIDSKRFTLSSTLRGALLVIFFLFAFTTVADAEVTKIYNATHSLTGDCNANKVDPVPDPGCPDEFVEAPEGPIEEPYGVTTDAYGDIYVINRNGTHTVDEDFTYIDIFDPEGRYVGGFPCPYAEKISVDSTGHLYVVVGFEGVFRYEPTVFNPAAGEIAYGTPPILIFEGLNVAVNPINDHVFMRSRGVDFEHGVKPGNIVEFGPPTAGVPNQLLFGSIGEGILDVGNASSYSPMAFDKADSKLYVADGHVSPPENKMVIKVLEGAAPYNLIGTIDGSTAPSGQLVGPPYYFSLAVDEKSGHIFAGSLLNEGKLNEFEPDGSYVGMINKPTFSTQKVQIAIDNSEDSPNQGYLYIPSGQGFIGNIFAYEPLRISTPPVIESISRSGVSEEEAVLEARVNPEGENTHYSIEYTGEEDSGFVDAQLAGEGTIPAGSEGVAVSAPVSDLSPGSAYRFRVRAENQCEPGGCVAEAQSRFTTFAPYALSGSCANEALREGISKPLPDCRAYELVSPPRTDGKILFSPPGGSGDVFATWTGSPDGSSVAFMAEGGGIPEYPGTGSFLGDGYVSRRTAQGWQTESAELDGSQILYSQFGSMSPDHGFGIIDAETLQETAEDYIRYPDGSSYLIGQGSVGSQALVGVRSISPGGKHTIFESADLSTSPVKLEPNAPPDGTRAIYDRALDGALRVVSLLPEEATPSESASYDGTSLDGSVVAFRIGGSSPIYLRVDNSETQEAAPAGSTFAGLSEDGHYLFYLSGGDLYRFDTQGEEGQQTVRITEGANVTPVNVSRDGSAAYFVSESLLGEGPNPNGAEPVAGEQNLYYWDGAGVHFVGTVTESDVEGAGGRFGLKEWMEGLDTSGRQAARSSADGAVLLFRSEADLTPFQSVGRKQIYRYDADQATLLCLSCNPTRDEPKADAALLTSGFGALFPSKLFSVVPNLSSDGRRAFFESEEQLVPADTDGVRDVYEWEAEGKGTCAEPGGCLFVISSGKSPEPSYLYGASETGDDVFILTSDLLTGEDAEETRSIYDAKVGGGFGPRDTGSAECLGEACQPAAVAPDDPTPASSSFEGAGNVRDEGGTTKARCPKGKHAARKAGKLRCVPRHGHKKKNHKRAKANRRAGR